MSKSSKRMFHNMYENDVLDLDTLDDLEQIAPIKSNKAIKRAAKQAAKSVEGKSAESLYTVERIIP